MDNLKMEEILIGEYGISYTNTIEGKQLYEITKKMKENEDKVVKGVHSLKPSEKVVLDDLTRGLSNLKTGLVHLHIHCKDKKFYNDLTEATKELDAYIKELFKETKLEEKYFQLYEGMIKSKYDIRHWHYNREDCEYTGQRKQPSRI